MTPPITSYHIAPAVMVKDGVAVVDLTARVEGVAPERAHALVREFERFVRFFTVRPDGFPACPKEDVSPFAAVEVPKKKASKPRKYPWTDEQRDLVRGCPSAKDARIAFRAKYPGAKITDPSIEQMWRKLRDLQDAAAAALASVQIVAVGARVRHRSPKGEYSKKPGIVKSFLPGDRASVLWQGAPSEMAYLTSDLEVIA